MPKLDVKRTINIACTAKKVFSILCDFQQWQVWSPWLITEPEASMTIADDGNSYQWQGKRVGVGSMVRIDSQENQRVCFQLNFVKPWKSKASVEFVIKEVDDGVTVTWSMDSSLPIFMFWMKYTMPALIGMDYERGLLMLKDYIEKGDVVCQLAIQGEQQFSGAKYIGIKRQCQRSEMVNTMPEDFNQLINYAKGQPLLTLKKAGAIYHEFNILTGEVEYTAFFIINETPTSKPEYITQSTIPECKAYSILQTGPYRHLGNAWATMMGLQRAKAFKPSKFHSPFELYYNDPHEVSENELKTEIVFPCQ